jgi:hypothetical protein
MAALSGRAEFVHSLKKCRFEELRDRGQLCIAFRVITLTTRFGFPGRSFQRPQSRKGHCIRKDSKNSSRTIEEMDEWDRGWSLIA